MAQKTTADGLSQAEREAVKQRAKELREQAKAGKNREAGTTAVREAIDKLEGTDKQIAEGMYAVVSDVAPVVATRRRGRSDVVWPPSLLQSAVKPGDVPKCGESEGWAGPIRPGRGQRGRRGPVLWRTRRRGVSRRWSAGASGS